MSNWPAPRVTAPAQRGTALRITTRDGSNVPPPFIRTPHRRAPRWLRWLARLAGE